MPTIFLKLSDCINTKIGSKFGDRCMKFVVVNLLQEHVIGSGLRHSPFSRGANSPTIGIVGYY